MPYQSFGGLLSVLRRPSLGSAPESQFAHLTVTVISVLVALAMGSVELLQVLSGELNFSGPFWGWLGALDFEAMGYGIVAIFVLSWLISVVYRRHRQYDELLRNQLTSAA